MQWLRCLVRSAFASRRVPALIGHSGGCLGIRAFGVGSVLWNVCRLCRFVLSFSMLVLRLGCFRLVCCANTQHYHNYQPSENPNLQSRMTSTVCLYSLLKQVVVSFPALQRPVVVNPCLPTQPQALPIDPKPKPCAVRPKRPYMETEAFGGVFRTYL